MKDKTIGSLHGVGAEGYDNLATSEAREVVLGLFKLIGYALIHPFIALFHPDSPEV